LATSSETLSRSGHEHECDHGTPSPRATASSSCARIPATSPVPSLIRDILGCGHGAVIGQSATIFDMDGPSPTGRVSGSSTRPPAPGPNRDGEGGIPQPHTLVSPVRSPALLPVRQDSAKYATVPGGTWLSPSCSAFQARRALWVLVATVHGRAAIAVAAHLGSISASLHRTPPLVRAAGRIQEPKDALVRPAFPDPAWLRS
jgi:hypothetical protein